jgi:uncharacterized protein YkwD
MSDMTGPMRPALLALAAVCLTSGLACSGPPRRLRAAHIQDGKPESPLSSAEIAERVTKLVALHNEERAKEKRNSLEVSPKLTKATQRHADDMAKRKKMGHEGSDGSAPAERITDEGYRYRRVGENVAYGRWTPEGLMHGWLESPPHKRNILGSYSQIGAACAIAEDGTAYWCVTFGLPLRP